MRLTLDLAKDLRASMDRNGAQQRFARVRTLTRGTQRRRGVGDRGAIALRTHAAARIVLTAVVFLLAASPAFALRYRVDIAHTGVAELDEVLPQVSLLQRLRESDPPDPIGLIGRARGDTDRIRDAARSLGYYGATVDIRIDGKALDDPDLTGALEGGDAAREVPVAVAITPGQPYRLRRIQTNGLPPGSAVRSNLAVGAQAKAADILAAETALLNALRADGYAFARATREVVVDHDAKAADVTTTIEPGRRIDFGEVRFEGLDRVQEDFLRNRLRFAPGEQYSSTVLEDSRADLAGLGIFSVVRTRLGAEQPDADGRVPVVINVTERPRRTISFGAAYATDEGISLRASWMHRNLFGRAESLQITAELSRLAHNSPQDTTGHLDFVFRKPDIFAERDLALRLELSLIRERLDAYDRDAVVLGPVLERKFNPRLSGALGLQAEVAHLDGADTPHNVTLLGVPGTLTWSSVDNTLDPTRGFRATAALTPTQSFRDQPATYLLARVTGSTYINLGAPGRSVLATRLSLGSLMGADLGEVPISRRFFGGGGGSVRGYAFQSIGPRNASDQATGGLSILEASVEMRQRIGESWGAAAFVDAGSVSPHSFGFVEQMRVAVGVGARYYTAIGPIRLDVAVPLIRDSHSGKWQLYIGIGQAF
jgi:translocation and assembly module TamA